MDETLRQLKVLVDQKGKKLLWTGFDPESGGFYMMFEDRTAIFVNEVSEVTDFDSQVQPAMLADNLLLAEQFVELAKLSPAPAPAAPTPTAEPAHE